MMDDAGDAVLTHWHLGTWCASQVPDAQKHEGRYDRHCEKFMTTVADLLVVHATIYLRLPPKTASHEHAWRRWREGVLLMVAIICVAACY